MNSAPHLDDSNHSANGKARRFAARTRPLGILFNAFFTALFAALQVWPLVLAYLAGFACTVWLTRRENAPGHDIHRQLNWVWILLYAQSMLAVVLLGPTAGFHYYLIATLPAAFYNLHRPLSQKLIQAGLVTASLIGCEIWLPETVPLVTMSPNILSALAHFNTLGICLMLGGMAHAQALTVSEAEDSLRHAATIDVLTGLFNRRAIGGFIDTEAVRSMRKQHALSFIVCDVDHFKRVNDTWGHAAGDLVLKRVAAVLKSMLRGYDGIARWGGEEFLIVLPEASSEHAAAIADRIRQTLSGTRVEFQDQLIQVSMTFGVTELRAEENWQTAMARADQALYRGKAAGRNRVELA